MKIALILISALTFSAAFADGAKSTGRKIAGDESAAAKLLAGHSYCIQISGKPEHGIYDVRKDGSSKDFVLLGDAKQNATDESCNDAQIKWNDTGITVLATFCPYPSDC